VDPETPTATFIRSGEAALDQVWMIPGKNGIPRLRLYCKFPSHDRSNKVVGLAGLNRLYEFSADDSADFSRLMSVITFVTENYARDIEFTDMAEHSLLSVGQLQGEFLKSFGMTPNRYLREVRVGVVRHLRENSDQPLSTLATDCGFYDCRIRPTHRRKRPRSATPQRLSESPWLID
jgi:AraC-like DNA-binding protein